MTQCSDRQQNLERLGRDINTEGNREMKKYSGKERAVTADKTAVGEAYGGWRRGAHGFSIFRY